MPGRPPKPMLSTEEIARPFAGEWGERYPPILSVAQVAGLLGLSVKTIYEWSQKGRLDGTYRKRGKHLLFWRDKLINLIFNGSDWSHA